MRNIRIVIMSVLIVVGFQASNNAFSDVNVTTKFQESTYDGFRKLFKQLYKEIRIMDALSESNCSFYQFGSNDYKIGEIITYIEDTLIKKGPLYFVNNFDILKCENISKDDAFVLERGCFGLGYDKDNINTFTSLCLATDSVYNNWDCMRYDKKQNLFILFYGQAFAD